MLYNISNKVTILGAGYASILGRLSILLGQMRGQIQK